MWVKYVICIMASVKRGTNGCIRWRVWIMCHLCLFANMDWTGLVWSNGIRVLYCSLLVFTFLRLVDPQQRHAKVHFMRLQLTINRFMTISTHYVGRTSRSRLRCKKTRETILRNQFHLTFWPISLDWNFLVFRLTCSCHLTRVVPLAFKNLSFKKYILLVNWRKVGSWATDTHTLAYFRQIERKSLSLYMHLITVILMTVKPADFHCA